MRELLLIALLLAPAARAADDRPTRELKDRRLAGRINKAIARGVAYLKQVQGKDGSWEYEGRFPAGSKAATGGLTALALYALAASGVNPIDPSLVRGVRWTEKHTKQFGSGAVYGTYSASLLVLALTRIDERQYRTRIHRLAESLVKAQLSSDMWTYNLRAHAKKSDRGRGFQGIGRGDNSNSQFAILALWAACSLTDFKLPKKSWQRIRDLYRRTQLEDGSWSYSAPRGGRGAPGFLGRGRPSMTAAALVAYVYAIAALDGSEAALADARRSTVAKRGLKALMSARHEYRDYYFAYALERVGTVMDLPLANWYVPGSKVLVDAQKKDGRWTGSFGMGHASGQGGVYETALALLFLSRTTLPPRRAAITRPEVFPDLSDPTQLERGFDFYAAYRPERRARVLYEFAKAGPAAVGLFIRKLRHKQEAVRKAAFDLLARLCAKRFFFEPTWPREDREIMIGPVEEFWKRHGPALRWDAERKRFAVSR